MNGGELGMSAGRLEAFNDGVLAIVTTGTRSGVQVDCGGGQLAGGDRLGGSGRQVPVEAGAGDAGLGNHLGDGVPGGPQVGGVVKLGLVDGDRPADPAALGGRDGPGVGGSLEGVGPFHLP